MTGGELVSIITPAYNGARFIKQTIDSVVAQSYSNWEMVIVDDRSTDGTAELVEQIGAAEPRVRLIRQPKNQGPAHARNAALRAARGRYVAFLDSDDLWLPQKLEKQLQFMLERDSALSFTCFRRIDESGTKVGQLRPIPAQLSYRDLLKNTAIVTSTVVIDTKRTGPVTMPITYYDDFAAWLAILKRDHVAHGLAEDLVRYRVVGQSVSRKKGKSAMWVWRTYREIERLSLPYAAWCFVNYAWRGFRKYRSL